MIFKYIYQMGRQMRHLSTLLTMPSQQLIEFSMLKHYYYQLIPKFSMGAECSCSNVKVGAQNQIRHDSSPEGQVKTPQSIEGPADEPRVDSPQAVSEEGEEVNSNDQLLAEKTQRKNQKKVVKMMVPQSEKEENCDQVAFIQKQTDPHQNVLIGKTLGNHFILSQLSQEEIQYVVRKMRFCKASAGTYIFKQGDPSFSYYVILEGKCSVFIDNEMKRSLEPGTSFGDLGIIYNAPRSASILAQTDCILGQLNSMAFRRIVNDLNSMYEQQNKAILEGLQFYKNLQDNEKNVLASSCIVETYQAGQMVFNKGDAANAFYVVQEGIVTLVEKNLDLMAGESVGVNAILGNTNATRSCSLIAKTSCRLVSLTRDIITKNLGDNINHIFRRNLVLKVLKESDIWQMHSQQQWVQISENMEYKVFKKGNIIFDKANRISPYTLYIILKADARSKSNPKANFYIANSVIEPNKVFKKQQFVFESEFIAQNEIELVKLTLPNPPKGKTKSGEVCAPPGHLVISKIKPKPNMNLDDFIVLRSLRSGNFGKVYACYNRALKSKFAIKVMNKVSLASSSVLTYIEKETELMESIPENPFLIKYYQTFFHENLIMIVMELIEGEDLFDAVNSKIPLKPKDLKILMAQLITVVDHLHNSKVIYRDLKPQNVMLNLSGHITLVDLGTAKKLTIESRFKTSTIIGTPHYMAPEILLGKGYTFIADWWSLGVMLYEMACGKLPYGQNLEDPFAVYQQIIRNELVLPPILNIETKDLIEKLLTKNMFKRMKNGSMELKAMSFFSEMQWNRLAKKQYEGRLFPAKSSLISAQEIEKMLTKKKLQPALHIFLKSKEEKASV